MIYDKKSLNDKFQERKLIHHNTLDDYQRILLSNRKKREEIAKEYKNPSPYHKQ